MDVSNTLPYYDMATINDVQGLYYSPLVVETGTWYILAVTFSRACNKCPISAKLLSYLMQSSFQVNMWLLLRVTTQKELPHHQIFERYKPCGSCWLEPLTLLGYTLTPILQILNITWNQQIPLIKYFSMKHWPHPGRYYKKLLLQFMLILNMPEWWETLLVIVYCLFVIIG